MDISSIDKVKNYLKNVIGEYIKLLSPTVDTHVDIVYREDGKIISQDEKVGNFVENNNIFESDDKAESLNTLNLKFIEEFRNDENHDDNGVRYFNFVQFKDDPEKLVCYLRFEGFEDNVVYIYKRLNTYSFLKFVLDGIFIFVRDKQTDFLTEVCDLGNQKINDHLSSLGREYMVYITQAISKSKLSSEDKRSINTPSNNLFDELNYISTLNYEGSSVSAKLLLLDKSLMDNHVSFYFKLDKVVRFNEHRKIRKLLETSDKSTYLIGDNGCIYGLGRLKNLSEISESNEKPIFIIDFLGRFEYKVKTVFVKKEIIKEFDDKYEEDIRWFLEETTIVNIKFGKPSLRENKFSKDKLKFAIEKVFESYLSKYSNETKDKDEKIQNIVDIVNAAQNQRHGTMVVITKPDIAKSEIEKLESQSIKINNVSLSRKDANLVKLIERVTCIDGALYIDIEGNCYAIGVILDGFAEKGQGDSSRGARYNSALRYENKKELKGHCVIVVISEDGMVDIIPDREKIEKDVNRLLNEIKVLFNKNEVEEALKKVEEVKTLDSKAPKTFYKLAVLLNKSDKYKDEVIQNLTKAIELDENYVQAYNGRGTVYYRKGEFDKALEDFNKAIELDKSYVPAYNGRGSSYAAKGEYDKALEDHNKAIELDKDYIYAYNGRGNAYAAKGEYDKALEDYNRAIELDKSYKLVYENLNILYKKLIKIEPEREGEYQLKIEENDRKIQELNNQ